MKSPYAQARKLFEERIRWSPEVEEYAFFERIFVHNNFWIASSNPKSYWKKFMEFLETLDHDTKVWLFQEKNAFGSNVPMMVYNGEYRSKFIEQIIDLSLDLKIPILESNDYGTTLVSKAITHGDLDTILRLRKVVGFQKTIGPLQGKLNELASGYEKRAERRDDLKKNQKKLKNLQEIKKLLKFVSESGTSGKKRSLVI